MPFDPFSLIASIEKFSPKLGRTAAMLGLSWMSPFNRHLRAQLLEWTADKVVIAVKRRRRVRNHVGSIHAGALFTLGETCAGLVIIRNFPFGGFRPLMSDVRVTYSKQARGDVTGECHITPDDISRMREVIASGEVPSIEMVTNILNTEREVIAVVTTQWQVKPWQLVKLKPA